MIANDKRLGRRVQFDDRSRRFNVAEVLPTAPKLRGFTWSIPVQLDQGEEGACVGHGWAHELAARPVKVPGIDNDFAYRLYREAQAIDAWPETGEGGEDGTSVLAGAQVLKARGVIPAYRWNFDGAIGLALAVGYKGPAVLGIDWREGMSDTDAKGFIHATGQVMGGHAIVCHAVNVKQRYFTFQNSWGSGWGVQGRCKLSFDDMDALLASRGECCIPVKRLNPR